VGRHGYAWLHEDFLKAYWVDKIMAIPDVQPMQVARLRLRAHGHLTARCGGARAPDSISGMCAARCADGSPRHNNVCPLAPKDGSDKSLDCPRGMVNTTGECVLAAPRSQGADAASKVRWECASAGCIYTIPKDKLDCKDPECEVSCPAPDFRLATTQRGLVCVE
jgi:hypothetical protein